MEFAQLCDFGRQRAGVEEIPGIAPRHDFGIAPAPQARPAPERDAHQLPREELTGDGLDRDIDNICIAGATTEELTGPKLHRVVGSFERRCAAAHAHRRPISPTARVDEMRRRCRARRSRRLSAGHPTGTNDFVDATMWLRRPPPGASGAAATHTRSLRSCVQATPSAVITWALCELQSGAGGQR